jgi:hypothetical protein
MEGSALGRRAGPTRGRRLQAYRVPRRLCPHSNVSRDRGLRAFLEVGRVCRAAQR